MFKAAFITDLHFGIRGNSDVFLENIRNYMFNEFIPYLIDNRIEHVFIGGDIFDNRQSVNIKTFNYVIDFFNKLQMHGLKVIVIAGNHDLYLSTSNDLTSLSFLTNYPNVTFIQNEFQKVSIDGTDILFVPWISNIDTFVNSMATVMKTEQHGLGTTCIGHFQLLGFPMNKNSKLMDEGMPDSVLTRIFKTVISGHYHMRSEKTLNGALVMYTGSPYQLTRADAGEDRGFCVLTFDENKLIGHEYINNKNCIKFVSVKFPQEFTEDHIKGNVVDIIVDYAEKFDELKLDEYKAKIESMHPACKPEIRLAGGTIDRAQGELELTDFSTKSTIDLIIDYMKIVEIEEKQRVQAELIDLYNQVKVAE